MTFKSSHIQNLFLLISGTLFASAINFFGVPILARFYSPSAFGTLGAIVGVATVASVAVINGGAKVYH